MAELVLDWVVNGIASARDERKNAMKLLLADLRYALRQLRRSPGFALTAVLTLALGIGATSTILSWISATLFNPIPGAKNIDSMLTIQRGERSEHPSPPFSYPDFVDLRENARTLSGLIGYHDDYISITGSAKPERIYGALTSADYFEVLGVQPYLGRTLISTKGNERAGAAVAVLSYSLWQNHFAGDPGIIGKTIQLNLHPYTIVGIAPKGFRGCKSGLRTDIFLPLGMDQQIWAGDRIDHRGTSWLNVLAVLRPGIDSHQADNELNLLMQRIASQYPVEHQGANQISTDPLWRSPFGANVYMAGTLPILLALATVLLLLACANVANLLLVRSVARRREFAIRLSMGASRWVLVRQLMVENVLIALAGGAVALSTTLWTSKTLRFLFARPHTAACDQRRGRSARAAGDDDDLVAHGNRLRRGACAARIPAIPQYDPEGRSAQHFGWVAQVASDVRTCDCPGCAVAVAAHVRGIVCAQPGEGAGSRSGLRFEPRASDHL